MDSRLEMRIQEHLLDRYKQQHPNWLASPALRWKILVDVFSSGLWLVAVGVSGMGVIASLVNFGGDIRAGVSGVFLSLALGLMAAGVIVWRGFNDERRQNRLLLATLPPDIRFDLAAIRDRRLRTKLVQALQQWAKIQERGRKGSEPAKWPLEIAGHQRVTIWLQQIYCRAYRADQTRLTLAAQGNLPALRQRLRRAEALLPQAQTAQTRQRLTEAVHRQRLHLETLTQATDRLKRVDEQLDRIVTLFELISSQWIVTHTAIAQPTRLAGLQYEMEEELARLQDLAQAAQEVYGSNKP
ncbi:MAG: hypothetical protein R3264_05880 [Anaerolineae bacterium]|nr:hypothetical protein [Anaerolineae bacterium]